MNDDDKFPSGRVTRDITKLHRYTDHTWPEIGEAAGLRDAFGSRRAANHRGVRASLIKLPSAPKVVLDL